MSKTVCVVDDQPSLRQMLRFTLNAYGYNVLEAENGVEALKIISKEHVDMMVVDWQMPLMDGLELVRKLRKITGYEDLPVIIVSCRDDLVARKEAYSLGVINWMKKPFRMAEIQRVVESGFSRSVQTSPFTHRPAGNA